VPILDNEVVSQKVLFFIQTINRTSASDDEIEEAEIQFLAIFHPKVQAPTTNQIQQMVVVDEWPKRTPTSLCTRLQRTLTLNAIASDRTPSPIPSGVKWAILPVNLSWILFSFKFLIEILA